jgi:SNF2 family DNA or RNA helicase
MTDIKKSLLPVRVGIDYLRHQEVGIRWMLDREAEDAVVCRGGILADDMGLGKTFQTIGLLKNSPLTGLRTLIVCPPALIAGWTEELRACGYFVSTLLTSGTWTRPGDAAERDIVALTTYPKVVMYRRAIAEAAFDRVILDEGHAIRNGMATSRWMSCMAVAAGATTRWILSATPVQNGKEDWRNLCWWLRVRCPAIDIPRLGDVIMLRRTMEELRRDIAALPPAPRFVAHNLGVPAGGAGSSRVAGSDSPSHSATGAEYRLFRALCDRLEAALESKHTQSFIKLELYLRIQQFLVHPQIYVDAMRDKFGPGYRRPDWTGTATKWEAFHAELERAVVDRAPVIVFCNFRAEMDRVAAAAAALGARVWSVRGGMTADAVGAAVRDAREAATAGKEPVVFVVQIVAGGAGLNLQFCKRVLFLSQHWNPAVVHQAVGRAVRIGQRDVVEIHTFRIVDDVMDNLDRRMVEVHVGKITAARGICETLYEGFEKHPIAEEAAATAADEEEGDPTEVAAV